MKLLPSLLSLLPIALAAPNWRNWRPSGPHHKPNHAVSTAPVSPFTIYTFNSTILPENIFLRSNDQLLVTCLTCPYIFQLDPEQGPGQTPKIIHEFTGYSAVTGIVQLQPGFFAVGVGNFTLETGGVNGTWGIWTVDLRHHDRAIVSHVASSPQATILGGLVLINETRGFLAATDFYQQRIWSIDIQQNLTTPLIISPELGPPGEGVNGLKLRDDSIYLATSALPGLYAYIPVDTQTGEATGGITTVYPYDFRHDDITFADSGNVYLTSYNSTPGGIYRREAGTPAGQNGTTRVIDKFGTNSVITNDTGCGCDVLFTAAFTGDVLRARLPGAC